MHKLVADYADKVYEATNGRIEVVVYPGGLLGDYTTQTEAVSAGTQELCLGYISTSVVGKKANIKNLPYFLVTDEAVKRAYGQDGWMYQIVVDLVQPNVPKWKFLASYCFGEEIMYSNKKIDPLPGKSDAKLRVMAVEMVAKIYEARGYHTLTMSLAEVASALMLGTIDGGVNASWGEVRAMYADLVKYIYRDRAIGTTGVLIVNRDTFDALSPTDQDIIERLSSEWGGYVADELIKDNAKIRQEAEAKGVEIYEFTDEEWLACAKVVIPETWPLAEELVGKDVIAKIVAEASKNPLVAQALRAAGY